MIVTLEGVGRFYGGCLSGKPSALLAALLFIQTKTQRLQVKLTDGKELTLTQTAEQIKRELRLCGLSKLKLVGAIILALSEQLENAAKCEEIVLDLGAMYKACCHEATGPTEILNNYLVIVISQKPKTSLPAVSPVQTVDIDQLLRMVCLAESFTRRGEHGRAVNLYRKITRLGVGKENEADLYTARAQAVLRIGGYHEAVNCCRRAMPLVKPDDPKRGLIFELMAEGLFHLGKPEEASSLYYQAAKESHDVERKVNLYRLSGLAGWAGQNYKKAAIGFNAAAELCDGEAARNLWVLAAASYRLAGEHYSAGYCCESAARHSNGLTQAYLWAQAAQSYVKGAGLSQATFAYRHAVLTAKGPLLVKCYLDLADIHIFLRNYRFAALNLHGAARELKGDEARQLWLQSIGFAILHRDYNGEGYGWEGLARMSTGQEAKLYWHLTAESMARADNHKAMLFAMERMAAFENNPEQKKNILYVIAEEYQRIDDHRSATFIMRKLSGLN